MPESPPTREELVVDAVKRWTDALVDLGGRNNLLKYRDLKQGTLDLTEATPASVTSLLKGTRIRASTLFDDAVRREDSIRRIRTIRNKAKENFEERGLETLSVAFGLATWKNDKLWSPRAPALLRPALIKPLGAAQDDFELELINGTQLNATLLHVLKVDFDCVFDQEALYDYVDGEIDQPWEVDRAFEWMREGTRNVPGFEIESSINLANFAYPKLAMAQDLAGSKDHLEAHDLIAALAGDQAARHAIQSRQPSPDEVPGPDHVPLADEFLVLDADSSQNYAINSVLAGQSMIIKGPPGTGKSQTIANLIGSLIAREKRVLFVAEKRAAIDAVTKRLTQKGLGDLVLDLHGGVASKSAFAKEIGKALDAIKALPPHGDDGETDAIEARRTELNDYVTMLHSERPQWGLSVYGIRAELLGFADEPSAVRFRGDTLMRLDASREKAIAISLQEYAHLGGFEVGSGGGPWKDSPVETEDEVRRADGALDQLRRHTLVRTHALLLSASEETGLPAANTIADWGTHVALWQDVASVLRSFTDSVFDVDLESTCEMFSRAQRGVLARLTAYIMSSSYRESRDRLRAVLRASEKVRDEDLYGRASAARDALASWRRSGGHGRPVAPATLEQIADDYSALTSELADVEGWVGTTGLAEMPVGAMAALLESLVQDRATLVKLPALHRLRRTFLDSGLDELMAELTNRRSSSYAPVQAFRFAWLRSIMDHLELNMEIGAFDAARQEMAVEEFQAGDRSHVGSTPARLRREYAQAAVRARERFSDQDALVKHQVGLKKKHLPVRNFVRAAPDVLLALKPCWAMSPLLVSQLLPQETVFDVVIFDEASQITPADAVTSIARGKQLVVAGDERQLPPTAFFVSEDAEDDATNEPEPAQVFPVIAGTAGFESILDALQPIIPFRTLTWHYRSQDERLIAFSNVHVYDRMLTTFPGTADDNVLTLVEVGRGGRDERNSPTSEVERVVDLILEHADSRQKESLGVIAMGITHATRIEEHLRQRLSAAPDVAQRLADFFDEDRDERFFVKNLERVQGDERDAIILSVGYGKNPLGTLNHNFGPLNKDGGERRLNVAVTRAKKRLTLVTSFSHRDIDPTKSDADGVILLRRYLEYVESGGTDLAGVEAEKPVLNPFEIDVRDTLTDHGLRLVPQFGASGYRIDFAVRHPARPGRYVLAIECDGATYHSSESARDRDRLRQEQLERLGWRFHRIWSSEWFYKKERALEKALTAYKDALTGANGSIAAVKEPPGREPPPVAEPPEREAHRQTQRPHVPEALPIGAHAEQDLIDLATWCDASGTLTRDELLGQLMLELGHRRRGKDIVNRLEHAIETSRGQQCSAPDDHASVARPQSRSRSVKTVNGATGRRVRRAMVQPRPQSPKKVKAADKPFCRVLETHRGRTHYCRRSLPCPDHGYAGAQQRARRRPAY